MIMKDNIIANLHKPKELETIYRGNKTSFRKAIRELHSEMPEELSIAIWHERLHHESEEVRWDTGRPLVILIILGLIAGIIAKLPVWFEIDENFYYPRNIGFIIFPVLSVYFLIKNQADNKKIIATIIAMLAAVIYINLLPQNEKSDTLILSCIHLILVQWSILAYSFVPSFEDKSHRLAFLRYNGDIIVMTTLILIAGGIMSGLTVGLFTLIGFNIAEVYFENVGLFGASAAPVVATYLIQSNPNLVGKISPVLARIFSPLVLIMLIVYLIAIVYSGKDPYNDREFLMIFNALLIGVMALIFFSVAETNTESKTGRETWILILLSGVTIIINGIALSAIIFRIAEWGITPNRAAVFGSNMLILINLVLINTKLYHVLRKRGDLRGVGELMAGYIPIYIIWAIIVTILFPLIFGMK